MHPRSKCARLFIGVLNDGCPSHLPRTQDRQGGSRLLECYGRPWPHRGAKDNCLVVFLWRLRGVKTRLSPEHRRGDARRSGSCGQVDSACRGEVSVCGRSPQGLVQRYLQVCEKPKGKFLCRPIYLRGTGACQTAIRLAAINNPTGHAIPAAVTAT